MKLPEIPPMTRKKGASDLRFGPSTIADGDPVEIVVAARFLSLNSPTMRRLKIQDAMDL